MAKEVFLHAYKTGRFDRYGYYSDLRSAGCAHGLLLRYGWDCKPVKHLPQAGKYYVRSTITNHQPHTDENIIVTKGNRYYKGRSHGTK